MTALTSDTHPEYFYEGSPLNSFVMNDSIFTAKDFSEIVLIDNHEVPGGTFIVIEVKACNE